MLKKTIFCALAIVCILPLASQSEDSSASENSITTVEEAYLGSAESVIIRELARSAGYDAKLTVLRYIEEALEGGNGGDYLFDTLTSLAGEGMLTIEREEGRIANNYPDIRRRACELLGRMGSTQAVPTLIFLLRADKEPSVASAAIRALADIGYNDNDLAIETINWVAKRFHAVLPTSTLALDILDAYERLMPSVENKAAVAEIIVMLASSYNYPAPVRERAYEVLKIALSGGDSE